MHRQKNHFWRQFILQGKKKFHFHAVHVKLPVPYKETSSTTLESVSTREYVIDYFCSVMLKQCHYTQHNALHATKKAQILFSIAQLHRQRLEKTLNDIFDSSKVNKMVFSKSSNAITFH